MTDSNNLKTPGVSPAVLVDAAAGAWVVAALESLVAGILGAGQCQAPSQ
jgi:hypothetical protein